MPGERKIAESEMVGRRGWSDGDEANKKRFQKVDAPECAVAALIEVSSRQITTVVIAD